MGYFRYRNNGFQSDIFLRYRNNRCRCRMSDSADIKIHVDAHLCPYRSFAVTAIQTRGWQSYFVMFFLCRLSCPEFPIVSWIRIRRDSKLLGGHGSRIIVRILIQIRDVYSAQNLFCKCKNFSNYLFKKSMLKLVPEVMRKNVDENSVLEIL